MFRTITCGQLREKDEGREVKLSGWVYRRRDHGGLIFIDLRDYYGYTQLVFDPSINQAAWETASQLRSEWVISVEGKVRKRTPETVNSRLKTGKIELAVSTIKVLSRSMPLPFEIDDEKAEEPNENLRLKYRFLDLRRKKLQEILKTKDEMFQYIRGYLRKENFLEIQTPILANSSPEGARDFLIPSRLQPGKFYALPQAPQQFKQLLMIGGIDRYFQIAPCFRDEDPRADRHYGEFYQLDIEMAFVEQEDIWEITEALMKELSQKFSVKQLVALDEKGNFPRISWREAMERFGTDKPDLRYGLEIKPITNLVKNSGFKVFAEVVQNGGVVHALKVDGGEKFSRKDIDELTELAQDNGAAGLAYILIKDDGSWQSPIIKFLGEETVRAIISHVAAQPGDAIFFGADNWRTVCASLGAVREECATKLNLKDETKLAWCWVVDFPMFDYSEIEEGRIDFSHNPFSMPQGGLEALQKQDPLEILAYQFDLVLNGVEISSGAIRNHDPEIMYKAFEVAGYSREEVDEKFGAMINAFKYGAPPHGGNAPGLDRLLMILQGVSSIRDVYAFPKDGQGRDLLMNSPNQVEPAQLNELRINLSKEIKKETRKQDLNENKKSS